MPGVASMMLGLVLMSAGTVAMWGWLSGKSSWFGSDVFDKPDSTKSDRMMLYVTFVTMVLAPLLSGAILITYGLYRIR